MKRIVILRCLRSNNVCTGAAACVLLIQKAVPSPDMGEEPLELEAYWSCNAAVTAVLSISRTLKKS